MSGTISYTIDERSFTANASPSNGATASHFVFSIDLSSSTPWSRYFVENAPFLHSLPFTLSDERKIGILHNPQIPWRFFTQPVIAFLGNVDVVGTVVRTVYTYDSETSSWNVTTTDPAADITFDFFASITGGGDPISGGKSGDVDDNKATIALITEFQGGYSGSLPVFNDEFLRLPWEEEWDPETTYFSDFFTTMLDDRNTDDGGGHSGSCSVSLNFTNV